MRRGREIVRSLRSRPAASSPNTRRSPESSAATAPAGLVLPFHLIGGFVFEFLCGNRPVAAGTRSPTPAPAPATSLPPATAVPVCRINPSPADAAPHAPGSSAASDAAPASPATAPAAAAPASPGPPSTTPATNRNAANAPASPNPPDRSSTSPTRSLSPVADAPAPIAPPPAPPLRETPARSRTPPPPPALASPETAENTCPAPPSRWSPAPPAKSCLLLPAPSCNKISGEDLLQRGSSRASFRACASSTYSTLGGTLFLVFITSEPSEGPMQLTARVHRSFASLKMTVYLCRAFIGHDTSYWPNLGSPFLFAGVIKNLPKSIPNQFDSLKLGK